METPTQRAGWNACRLTGAADILQAGLQQQIFTHATTWVSRAGAPDILESWGAAEPDTIYDLASLTKPLCTASLLLQLVERGQVHLQQTVAEFFEPEYGRLPHLSGMILRHLLTHTSGLPPIPRRPMGEAQSRQDYIGACLSTPLLTPPGEAYAYSDTGYILLGEIVGQTTRIPLDIAFQGNIAQPLGMRATGFLPSSALQTRIAPTGAPSGSVHDPRARELGGVSGHAGLFGTAADLAEYARALMSQGGGILSRAAVAKMMASQIPAGLGGQSFGWFTEGNDLLPSGDLLSSRCFGHSGFTGTLLLLDPEYDLIAILLTNRAACGANDPTRYLKMRRHWINAIAASIL